jgi:uncharacterized lipoprotein YbaY
MVHLRQDRRQTEPRVTTEIRAMIKDDATDSKTWWPLRVVLPQGGPNVLLIGMSLADNPQMLSFT